MKERPLPLHAWEVYAILDWRKTQLRRPIKPQPDRVSERVTFACGTESDWPFEYDKPGAIVCESARCPLGIPGDRLWSQETWSFIGEHQHHDQQAIHFKGQRNDWPPERKWKSSTQMPRWASRITLEITNVRVERVQDISEDDAVAEGSETIEEDGEWYLEKYFFFKLWDKRYAKRGFGSDLNPWAWVIDFKTL